jgi:hypothetical protein
MNPSKKSSKKSKKNSKRAGNNPQIPQPNFSFFILRVCKALIMKK